jgi:hypothetical protein
MKCCSGCDKEWSGHRRCHCTGCHENFSSVSAFDKHRKDFACRQPAETGLVLADGYWSHPGERPTQPEMALLGAGATGKRPKPAVLALDTGPSLFDKLPHSQ